MLPYYNYVFESSIIYGGLVLSCTKYNLCIIYVMNQWQFSAWIYLKLKFMISMPWPMSSFLHEWEFLILITLYIIFSGIFNGSKVSSPSGRVHLTPREFNVNIFLTRQSPHCEYFHIHRFIIYPAVLLKFNIGECVIFRSCLGTISWWSIILLIRFLSIQGCCQDKLGFQIQFVESEWKFHHFETNP